MSRDSNILVLSDGRKLGYAEYGDPKGKPVFYFHGWPSSRLRGSRTDETAKKIHVRLLSPDRPGYGLSTYKKNRTLLDWPDDVIELANHLKINKFAVEGVSGGGPYAAVCAYKIPERLTKVGIVVGLAPTWIPGILEGMPWTGKIGWANYSKFPLLAYLGSIQWLIILNYLPYVQKIVWWNSADKKEFDKWSDKDKKMNKEAFRQGLKGAVKDLLLYTSDWGFDIIKIKAKVYLFYGEVDTSVPMPMAKYYEKQIKDSKLKVYPKEGHLISRIHAGEIFKALTT